MPSISTADDNSPTADLKTDVALRDLDATDESSDEEFYIHPALLPFRKSRSTAFGAELSGTTQMVSIVMCEMATLVVAMVV